jgi:uncharacterized protein (TIGR04255 family)
VDVSEATIKSDTSGERVGHIFRTQDGRRFIQSRLNGFSYSVIPPYDRWESFSGEAWTNWTNYKTVAQPVKTTRIGVRYVNRIDVPSASIEIKDYLRTAVDVSPYLPQAVSSYFLQVVVPVSRFNASATITSTLAPPPAENMTSLILDIDIWRIVELSLDSTEGNDSLREQLESLRVVKNYVFESCITDATRGVISLCQYLCQPGEVHHQDVRLHQGTRRCTHCWCLAALPRNRGFRSDQIIGRGQCFSQSHLETNRLVSFVWFTSARLMNQRITGKDWALSAGSSALALPRRYF